MQSEVIRENSKRDVRVMVVEFGQEESYRIHIGFWNRFHQTITKILSFIFSYGKVLVNKSQLVIMVPYQK